MDVTTESVTHKTSCCSLPSDEDVDSSFPVISLVPIRLPKNHKYQSGYDCEFTNPPPSLIQSECTVCLLIFRHPHLVSCCGHNYCKDCITQIIDSKRPCPLCKSDSFTVLHNQDLERSLAQLEVRCSHHKLGCQWTGELGKYDKHLNINPVEEEQLVGCKYVELECSYKCGSWFHRGAISKHQNEKCPQRPFCCDYCHEYTSIQADVVYRHWTVCKCYPMSCPNHCTAYAIERQNLDDHLELECPLKLIECEFCGAGCEEMVVREEMSDHLEEWHMQHTSMLATANQKLVDELVEKGEEMAQMKKDGEEELVKVKDEAQRQMDNLWVENAFLKQEVTQIRQELDELKKELLSFSGKYKKTQAEREEEQKNTLQKLESNLSELRTDFEHSRMSLSQQCYSVQASVGVFPMEFVMTDFSLCLERKEEWRSVPFYSHLQGYRFCLTVNPSETEDSHLAVHASLMHGEYDNKLKWPFHGEITVQLRNFLTDRHHATGVIRFTEMTPSRYMSKVEGENGEKKSVREGWGLKRFIRHSELSYNEVKNRQYLKDDKLCFRVLKVHLSD